jgi:hypothetical protein
MQQRAWGMGLRFKTTLPGIALDSVCSAKCPETKIKNE